MDFVQKSKVVESHGIIKYNTRYTEVWDPYLQRWMQLSKNPGMWGLNKGHIFRLRELDGTLVEGIFIAMNAAKVDSKGIWKINTTPAPEDVIHLLQ